MATNFDPRSWSRSWFPPRAVDLGRRLLDPAWPEQWGAFTTAWLDPVADLGAGTFTALLPDMLMSLLSEGILGRFGGRQVDATLLGHDLSATLQVLKVRRRGAHFETKTVLTGLHWNGHPIETMTVVARGVRLVPGVPTKIRTSTLDITGTVTTAAVLGRLTELGRDVPGVPLEWELGVADDGLITARHRRRGIKALVDAVITDNLVTIAVLGASWRGIPIPRRRLRPAPIPLTGLPRDTRIVRADRDGHRVHFHIHIPEVTGSFDLTQIRSAIVAGTTLIIF